MALRLSKVSFKVNFFDLSSNFSIPNNTMELLIFKKRIERFHYLQKTIIYAVFLSYYDFVFLLSSTDLFLSIGVIRRIKMINAFISGNCSSLPTFPTNR